MASGGGRTPLVKLKDLPVGHVQTRYKVDSSNPDRTTELDRPPANAIPPTSIEVGAAIDFESPGTKPWLSLFTTSVDFKLAERYRKPQAAT